MNMKMINKLTIEDTLGTGIDNKRFPKNNNKQKQSNQKINLIFC